MISHAVILAAGRGTRLQEITAHRSKAMAPIAGSPMIARVIDSLRSAGVSKYWVVSAPGDSELHAFCASRPEITVREQASPMGSGDALRACEADLHEPFVVSACDSLLDPGDIRAVCELFETTYARAALCVMRVGKDVSLETRSVVRLSGENVLEFIEKPSRAERVSDTTSLPLWVLSPDIFRELRALTPSPRGEYELPATFNSIIAAGHRIVAHTARGRHDLTNVRDLLELNCIFLRAMSPSISVHQSVLVPSNVTLIAPVRIDAGCTLGDGARIGPEVYMECGAAVAPGVQLREAVVTAGVTVHSSGSDRVYTSEAQ